MTENDARDVSLLQAFEEASPPSPSWTDDDRRWADRLALEAAPPGASVDAFVAERARHAMQRLVARERTVERWLRRPAWRWHWLAGAALLGCIAGVAADAIGSSQRINLLAPPFWGVLLWNFAVYLFLLGAALARPFGRSAARPGPLVRATEALLKVGRRVPRPSARTGAAPLARFATLWTARSAGLAGLRSATLLHVAAAALAVGLIAGLYLRGIALDYRAAWESTFLTPAMAHALVTTVLAPAAQLSGIALPDVAAFAALRAAPGDATSGAPAAPWIHLLALTLVLGVVVPRGVLALFSAARAAVKRRRFALPLGDAYFQRIARLQRGSTANVEVHPYAKEPSPQAVLNVQALLGEAFGPRATTRFAATAAFGAEETGDAASAVDAQTTHLIVLCDLGATPELESQGRFAGRLSAAAPGVPLALLIDEASFRIRFAAWPERLRERRSAWTALAEQLGSAPVFADLAAAPSSETAAALEAAFARPVTAKVA